ncbi:long-chain fatty acid--CoA ligase [Corallococcus praedator]|uniref:Long-chain fatty acid--CoA ligase n=1 Tax=Corallococcus praedator TaxID=2316724 RepID=A0ABX9QEF9_9BACT|nr:MULTISPECIES: AMP-binding protein [Corallococcus]RKH25622.1 long-chain fatty acid--CoA ligase [Corallococcus sp. CA031C]RKI02914.1 long-chain fatty acid--CoA ligase [Corallococcus praedator]
MTFEPRTVLAAFDGTQPAPDSVPAWWARSWEDPDGFAAAIAPAHAGRSTPFKSRTGQHHDFFHDLVVRHATTDRIALRAYSRAQGWRTLSYRQLHEQALRRATAWAGAGVKPGAKLCLLLHPGPELMVSLCAALGLGACVSLLPPGARAFIARRLDALAPQHIAAEPHQAPLLGKHAPLLLPMQTQVPPTLASHTYKPAEVVGLLFSPLANPSDVPLPLTAGDAWRSALVDGLLTFGLSPGDHLAAPGFHPLQHLPALYFTTLLRGATYLHVEPADLEVSPTLLAEHPVRALGITPALRDLLARARPPLKNVGLWFRDPQAPFDFHAWRDALKASGLSSVPGGNVCVDAAWGGAVLCSHRRVGHDVHTDIAPAPGRAWALRDFTDSGQDAAGDTGLFTPLPDAGRAPAHVVLTRVRGLYHHFGAREPRREGRVYPFGEVADVLREPPGPRLDAVGLAVPVSGMAGAYRSVLLVFTGDLPPGVEVSDTDVRRRIEQALGADALPDRIERFALHARRLDGQQDGPVDEEWCRAQYLTGSLKLKSGDTLFQALTSLRALVESR